jgi:DNA-binding beta-propeller fold protein YncE
MYNLRLIAVCALLALSPAFSAADLIYDIGNGTGGRVFCFDTTTHQQTVAISSPDIPNPGPATLAVDSAGWVYITGDRAVLRFEPGGPVTTFAAVDGSPRGMVFDSRGNLFVVTESGTILKVDSTGASTLFASSGLGRPTDIACDSRGNLYVSDEGGFPPYAPPKILKYSPDGSVSTFLNSGIGDPVGLACDSADNLYIADWSGRILKADPAGHISTFVQRPLIGPGDVAFGSDGTLYIGD